MCCFCAGQTAIMIEQLIGTWNFVARLDRVLFHLRSRGWVNRIQTSNVALFRQRPRNKHQLGALSRQLPYGTLQLKPHSFLNHVNLYPV